MQQTNPFQFDYQKIKPKGWYTNYRDYPISPQSSNNAWLPNDIVRFLITNTQGVMDPYRSYFQIQVTTNTDILPVGGLYVDGSAQSFFSQIVITSQGKQVERIQGYNFLASYLQDINFSEYVCQNRQMQGLGYSNFTANSWLQNSGGSTAGMQNWTYTPQSAQMVQCITNGFSPTSCRSLPKVGSSNTTGGMPLPALQNGNAISSTNWLWQGVGQDYNTDEWIGQFGLGMHLRAQYKMGMHCNNVPDSTTSTLHNSAVLPFLFNQVGVGKPYSNVSYNPKVPYQPNFIQSQTSTFYIAGKNQNVVCPNTGPYNGYNNFFVPTTSKGSFPPMISPTIPQCQIQNGNILPQKVPVSTKTFRFPLISSIIGVLIQPDQFLLIPMKALQQLFLQITLNPFAMCTTGYSDVTQFDVTGASHLIKRNFIISKILWHLDLYLLWQRQNKTYISQSLSKQIYVGATGWQLGSQYQIPNGQLLNNAWPTSSTAQFMNQVILFLVPNEYQVLPFCRQTTRFSGNITSFQIRFNSQFYPPQPITGNAGNPEILDSTGDNSLFFLQILKSQDFMFNTNYPHPKINRINFAINNRCYNPYATGPYMDPAMYNNPSMAGFKVNGDTAMGLPFLHQQRFQGKAVYSFSWQPYGHSKGMVHGINANLARPFEILLNCSPQGYYTKDQTMYIYIRYAKVVKYTNQGISVMGI